MEVFTELCAKYELMYPGGSQLFLGWTPLGLHNEVLNLPPPHPQSLPNPTLG